MHDGGLGCSGAPLVEHLAQRQLTGLGEDEPERALVTVLEHEHDGEPETRILERWAGDEQATARVHLVIMACESIISMVPEPPVVLTIAAHDPLGGAGLAADLTTFAALGVHGAVATTALTVQRLAAVDRVEPAAPDLVAAQIDGVVESFDVHAVKIGLLGSVAMVELVAARIEAGVLPAPVVDPVLVDGRGSRFVGGDIEQAMRRTLFPAARVLTPNLGEASVLAGRELRSADDVEHAAADLAGLGAELVVVTGGSAPGHVAVDVLIRRDGTTDRIESPWIDTPHVRGSGCTFAAATTARLAVGDAPDDAVSAAKRFVTERLRASRWPGLDGAGPVAHWFS